MLWVIDLDAKNLPADETVVAFFGASFPFWVFFCLGCEVMDPRFIHSYETAQIFCYEGAESLRVESSLANDDQFSLFPQIYWQHLLLMAAKQISNNIATSNLDHMLFQTTTTMSRSGRVLLLVKQHITTHCDYKNLVFCRLFISFKPRN